MPTGLNVLAGLQRGRGAAARAVLATPPTLEHLRHVLACIMEDPRWDRQVESRDTYYAELAVHLDLQAPQIGRRVEERASGGQGDETDLWLPSAVLAALVDAGDAEAGEVLTRLVRKSVLESEEPVSSEASTPRSRRSFVDASLSTTDLLEQATPWNRTKLVRVLSSRRGLADQEALLEATRSRSVHAGHVAWEVLASQGHDRLIHEAISVFQEHAGLPLEAQAPRVAERHGPKKYLLALPAETALPYAREWFFGPHPLSLLGAQILKRHAEASDGPVVIEALKSAWKSREMYRACDCVDILATAEHREATDTILEIDQETAYSYLRRRTTRFLVGAGVSHPAVASRLEDALWDCEGDTVLLAVRHARMSEATRSRLRELSASPFHDDDIRKTAAARLADPVSTSSPRPPSTPRKGPESSD